ncbi:MAG TPA: hypothetical protein VNK04_06665 [Gemmataceae bacterium]|nr:hypothetical protein [Gemmataceae bacterium]
MFRPSVCWPRLLLCGALVVLVLVFDGAVSGQVKPSQKPPDKPVPGKTPDKGQPAKKPEKAAPIPVPARPPEKKAAPRPPLGTFTPLKPTKELTGEIRNRFKEAIAKSEDPVSPQTAEVLDIAAQNYAYELTWFDKFNEFGWLNSRVNEVDLIYHQDFPRAARNGARNEAVREKFSQCLVERLREVMQKNPAPIIRINAARMLVLVAESGYEPVLDALLEILNEEGQNDAVVYYALQGIKELFKLQNRPSEPLVLKDKQREFAVIQAVMRVLERQGPMSASREEIEGARILRREAVRALAQTRQPALIDPKDKEKRTVLARPAVALLRLLADPQGFTPEPRLDERLEAAVGLARMQLKGHPDYQPDYAAEHIAHFVIQMADRNLDKDAKDMEPWKVHAARLADALEVMRAETTKNIKDRDVVKYVTEVVNRIRPILQTMEKGGTPRAGDLSSWLAANRSKNTMLFKDVPESAIKPTPATEETPPADKPAEKDKPPDKEQPATKDK